MLSLKSTCAALCALVFSLATLTPQATAQYRPESVWLPHPSSQRLNSDCDYRIAIPEFGSDGALRKVSYTEHDSRVIDLFVDGQHTGTILQFSIGPRLASDILTSYGAEQSEVLTFINHVNRGTLDPWSPPVLEFGASRSTSTLRYSYLNELGNARVNSVRFEGLSDILQFQCALTNASPEFVHLEVGHAAQQTQINAILARIRQLISLLSSVL